MSDANATLAAGQKILVTGAAGRLGGAIAGHLERQGHEVHRTDKQFPRRKRHVEGQTLERPPAIDLQDLTDAMSCMRLCQGKDVVVHFGNHPFYWDGVHDPRVIYTENSAMNMNVFTAAADCGVKKIVFASSVQTINGDRMYREGKPTSPTFHKQLPLNEKTPANAMNPYSLSKAAGEKLLEWTAKRYGIQCVALRICWVMMDVEKSRLAEMHVRDQPADWDMIDECCSYLSKDDLLDLMGRIVQADLPGYRLYMPASPGLRIKARPRDLYQSYFQGASLACSLDELDERGFVDISTITSDVGWVPKVRMFPVNR
jgi:nucleoside-diphosphate-sugar epimerase